MTDRLPDSTAVKEPHQYFEINHQDDNEMRRRSVPGGAALWSSFSVVWLLPRANRGAKSASKCEQRMAAKVSESRPHDPPCSSTGSIGFCHSAWSIGIIRIDNNNDGGKDEQESGVVSIMLTPVFPLVVIVQYSCSLNPLRLSRHVNTYRTFQLPRPPRCNSYTR